MGAKTLFVIRMRGLLLLCIVNSVAELQCDRHAANGVCLFSAGLDALGAAPLLNPLVMAFAAGC